MPRPPCALLLLWLATTPLHAETLLIDTSRSRAGFELRALWVKRIEGEFTRVEGVIERDHAGARFGVDVRIAAASVQMPKSEHADWARSGDFFDAERYPWIQFRADNVPEQVLREGGEVPGEITLRGTTQALSFHVAPAECPRPGVDCVVRARGEVERSRFGMDARRFVLGDRVRLDFAIRTHDQAAPPPPRDAG
jgi:polyisoprenoid-binding protein YceI